jgi:hypothetical protein
MTEDDLVEMKLVIEIFYLATRPEHTTDEDIVTVESVRTRDLINSNWSQIVNALVLHVNMCTSTDSAPQIKLSGHKFLKGGKTKPARCSCGELAVTEPRLHKIWYQLHLRDVGTGIPVRARA